MSLLRPPYPQVPAWARFYATLDVCPRCHADYESVLHQACEYEQQSREVSEGSRDRITCAKPSTPPRNTPASNVVVGVPKLVSR